MRRRPRPLRRRRIRVPRTRPGHSPSSSFGPSPPLRRRITLGRQARPDRVMPGPSRSRNRSPRAAATPSRRPHRRRPLRHPLHQPHLLHQLPRRGRRRHRRHRRLRSALGPGRAGVRATDTTSIPGHPATPVIRTRERRGGAARTVIRARTGSTTTTTRGTTITRAATITRATTTTSTTTSSTGTAIRTAGTRAAAMAAKATRAAATATTASV